MWKTGADRNTKTIRKKKNAGIAVRILAVYMYVIHHPPAHCGQWKATPSLTVGKGNEPVLAVNRNGFLVCHATRKELL